MDRIWDFLSRTRGGSKLHVTDMITYLYLFLSVIIMFGPVVWLVLSSFKTPAEVIRFPPRLLPYRQETVEIEGYDEPLPLYEVVLEDGSTAVLAQVRRVGLEAQMIDPANPDEIIKVNIENRTPVESVHFGLENYIEGVQSFNFARYLPAGGDRRRGAGSLSLGGRGRRGSLLGYAGRRRRANPVTGTERCYNAAAQQPQHGPARRRGGRGASGTASPIPLREYRDRLAGR